MPSGYHVDQARVVEGEPEGPFRKQLIGLVASLHHTGLGPVIRRHKREGSSMALSFRMGSGRCQPFLLRRICELYFPQWRHLGGSKGTLARYVKTSL